MKSLLLKRRDVPVILRGRSRMQKFYVHITTQAVIPPEGFFTGRMYFIDLSTGEFERCHNRPPQLPLDEVGQQRFPLPEGTAIGVFDMHYTGFSLHPEDAKRLGIREEQSIQEQK